MREGHKEGSTREHKTSTPGAAVGKDGGGANKAETHQLWNALLHPLPSEVGTEPVVLLHLPTSTEIIPLSTRRPAVLPQHLDLFLYLV